MLRIWIPIPNEALDLCETEEWLAVVDLYRRGNGVRWRAFTVTERSLATRWRVGNRRVWSIIERLAEAGLIEVVQKGTRRRPTSILVHGPATNPFSSAVEDKENTEETPKDMLSGAAKAEPPPPEPPPPKPPPPEPPPPEPPPPEPLRPMPPPPPAPQAEQTPNPLLTEPQPPAMYDEPATEPPLERPRPEYGTIINDAGWDEDEETVVMRAADLRRTLAAELDLAEEEKATAGAPETDRGETEAKSAAAGKKEDREVAERMRSSFEPPTTSPTGPAPYRRPPPARTQPPSIPDEEPASPSGFDPDREPTSSAPLTDPVRRRVSGGPRTPAAVRQHVAQELQGAPPTSWGAPWIGAMVGGLLVLFTWAADSVASGAPWSPLSILRMHIRNPGYWFLDMAPIYFAVLFQFRAAIGVLTSQKEALKRLASQLLESDHILQGLVPQVLDAVLLVDADGLVSQVNPAATAMFGATIGEELVNVPIDELLPGRKTMVPRRGKHRHTEQGRVIGLEWPMDAVRLDGSSFKVTVSGGPLPANEQRALFVVSEVTADLPTPVSAPARQEDLGDARRQLKEAENRDALVSSMAYGLLTPLNTLEGYATIVQNELRSLGRTKLTEHVDRVLGSGMQIRDVVERLIDFSKMRDGQTSVVLEPVLVGALAREVAETVRPLAEQNMNRFDVRVIGGDEVIRADQIRIRQVLDHVLRHAFRYTQRGTVSLETRFESRDGEPWVAFRIRDSGIGLSAEEIETIFDEEGNERSRAFAQSREQLRSMGGRLTVASERGKGTTVTVRMPAADAGGKTIVPDLDQLGPATAAPYTRPPSMSDLPGRDPAGPLLTPEPQTDRGPSTHVNKPPPGPSTLQEHELRLNRGRKARRRKTEPKREKGGKAIPDLSRIMEDDGPPSTVPSTVQPDATAAGKLVLVIGDGAVHKLVETLMVSEGFGVAWSDVADAVLMAKSVQPSAIIVAASPSGIVALEALKANAGTRGLPVVAIVDSAEATERAQTLGAVAFVGRPVVVEKLRSVLRGVH